MSQARHQDVFTSQWAQIKTQQLLFPSTYEPCKWWAVMKLIPNKVTVVTTSDTFCNLVDCYSTRMSGVSRFASQMAAEKSVLFAWQSWCGTDFQVFFYLLPNPGMTVLPSSLLTNTPQLPIQQLSLRSLAFTVIDPTLQPWAQLDVPMDGNQHQSIDLRANLSTRFPPMLSVFSWLDELQALIPYITMIPHPHISIMMISSIYMRQASEQDSYHLQYGRIYAVGLTLVRLPIENSAGRFECSL